MPKVQEISHLGESTFYWYPSSRESTNICCYPLCWCFPYSSARVFSVLNCCTITPKTYFRHQCKFLQPVIESVWKQQQISLFKEFIHGLVLSGDAHADSPGHCAKYGSYTVIESTSNKVIDFKLVQVGYSKYSEGNVMQSNEFNGVTKWRKNIYFVFWNISTCII